jgi:hypothetical protein
MSNTADTAARAICAERCAFMGEPACWEVAGEWPNPACDEPGCHALALAAVAALDQAAKAKAKADATDERVRNFMRREAGYYVD